MVELGNVRAECNRMQLSQASERQATDLQTGVERPNRDPLGPSSQMSRGPLPVPWVSIGDRVGYDHDGPTVLVGRVVQDDLEAPRLRKAHSRATPADLATFT